MFQQAIEHMLDGFAYCTCIYNEEGLLVDWVYTKVNPSFEALTHLHGAEGKKVSELIPELHETNPEVYEIYSKVASGGAPQIFETYVPSLNIWFRIAVYSIETGTFIAIFDNITASKEITAELQRLNRELDEITTATMLAWGTALELRDRITLGHTVRTADKAILLATQCGADPETLRQIYFGALLHDVGKMAIPDRILFKREELTEAEWKIMKQHPLIAYNFLKGIPFLKEAIEVAYCHHEAWDGSGYPRGLKGEEIPIAARIFTIVDVWDALISDRPYRSKFSYHTALKIMEDQAPKFDPRIFQCFLENMKEVPHGKPF